MYSSPFYRRAPIRVQEAAIGVRERILMALREGRRFRRVLAEINQSQWSGPAELAALQRFNVLRVVRHAARNVPYYRELFARNGWRPEDFADVGDLNRLPIVTKKDVLQKPDQFVSTQVSGPRFRISTSGTTGTPLSMVEDVAAIVRENAFIWRHLEWAGFKRGQRRAWLRGDMVVPIEQRAAPFWRYNRPANMLMMSSYHISVTNAHSYLAALADFDPHLILAYPSSIGLLAGILKNQNSRYDGTNLRSIVTSSETLTLGTRAMIEDRFRCRVFDHYGSSERVAIVGTCEAGFYHVESDYSFVEFENCSDGTRAIVGTAFNNLAMPLIRYDVGDRIGGNVTTEKCDCGRFMPKIDHIEGRLDDYVITHDGRYVGRLDHIFKDIKHVIEAQIRQDNVGEVHILVTPTADFTPLDERQIVANAKERLGIGFDVNLELVQEIPRGPSGKFRAVVRNVDAR